MKIKRERKGASTGEVLFFIGLLAAYLLTYFFRVSASVVLPMLASEWGMTATMTGLLSSMFFYTYALMQPISGVLNDRFGPSRVVSMGLVITGAGAPLTAFAKVAGRVGVWGSWYAYLRLGDTHTVIDRGNHNEDIRRRIQL